MITRRRRRFNGIDHTAKYVVCDAPDCLSPSPFWDVVDAEERANDLWENAYRPEIYRRVRNTENFELIPMTIEALTKRRAELNARLNAIAMWNTQGQSIDSLAAVELDKAKTLRELHSVTSQIDDYIAGGS